VEVERQDPRVTADGDGVALEGLGGVGPILHPDVGEVGAGAGVARSAGIVAGVLMIAWGVFTLLSLRGVSLPTLAPLAGAQRWMAARLRDVRDLPPTVRALTIGLLTTLLPCGWLYAFVVTAAGTGSVRGALTLMTVFWVGTLPVMLAFGVGIRRLAGPLRSRLPVLSALAIVLVGMMSLTGRLRLDPAKVAMRAEHMRPVPATGAPAKPMGMPTRTPMSSPPAPDSGHR